MWKKVQRSIITKIQNGYFRQNNTANVTHGATSVAHQHDIGKQNNFNGATIHAASLTIADEKLPQGRKRAKKA